MLPNFFFYRFIFFFRYFFYGCFYYRFFYHGFFLHTDVEVSFQFLLGRVVLISYIADNNTVF